MAQVGANDIAIALHNLASRFTRTATDVENAVAGGAAPTDNVHELFEVRWPFGF
ncbi:MAG TPA: hypothetical protein VI386_19670 [Candidatus Sulfotelmatobacter sp.]